MMEASYFTVAQTAAHLGLHPKTVLRFIHDGRLPAARIGKSYRLLRDEVMRFAGGAPAAPTQPGARVTSIVEIDALSAEQAERLGRALTVIGLRYLRSLGLAEVMLYVDETNTAAISLYSALGFKHSGTDVMFSRAEAALGQGG